MDKDLETVSKELVRRNNELKGKVYALEMEIAKMKKCLNDLGFKFETSR